MSGVEGVRKVAVVTGGSRGIGRAICRKLAGQGMFVIIHYGDDQAAAKDALAEIRALGGRGATAHAEFQKDTAANDLFRNVDLILKSEGRTRFDILVNNAGIGGIQDFEATTSESFDRLFAINVKAPFFITQQALSRMEDGGRIINISSIVTRMAMPAVPAYSMTKGAVDTMTLWLAKLLGPRLITVNSVAPGIVNTAMNADTMANTDARNYVASISTFNRVGEPQDIADVVAFLASPEAGWISGQRIEASGGSHL